MRILSTVSMGGCGSSLGGEVGLEADFNVPQSFLLGAEMPKLSDCAYKIH